MFHLPFCCLEKCLVTWPNRDLSYVTVSRHVAAAVAGGYQAQDHMFSCTQVRGLGCACWFVVPCVCFESRRGRYLKTKKRQR